MDLRRLTITHVPAKHRGTYQQWKQLLQDWWEELKPQIRSCGYDPLELRSMTTLFWGEHIELDPSNYWLAKINLGDELGQAFREYLVLSAQIRSLSGDNTNPGFIKQHMAEAFWVGEDPNFHLNDNINLNFQ